MQLLITVCHVDLSPGATKTSYTREGQATDSIIMNHDEAQEEAWKHRLPTGEERRQTVCKPQNTGGKELNISWQATRNMKSRLVISWKCLLTGFLFELTIFFTLRFISYEMTCTFLNCDL